MGMMTKTTLSSALLVFGACASDNGAEGGSGANGAGASDPAGVGASTGVGASNGVGANGAAAAAATSGSAASAATGAGAADGTAASSSVGSGGTGASTGSGGSAAEGWTDVIGAAGACQTMSVGADLVPPVLIFVIDKSGSMDRNDSPSTQGATKWEATRAALDAAFPAMPAEYAVGAVFYPNDDDCFTPPAGGLPVPVAPLDAAQVAALQTAVAEAAWSGFVRMPKEGTFRIARHLNEAGHAALPSDLFSRATSIH
jgi:hypothetical protein